jgi:hypothetical protein
MSNNGFSKLLKYIVPRVALSFLLATATSYLSNLIDRLNDVEYGRYTTLPILITLCVHTVLIVQEGYRTLTIQEWADVGDALNDRNVRAIGAVLLVYGIVLLAINTQEQLSGEIALTALVALIGGFYLVIR